MTGEAARTLIRLARDAFCGREVEEMLPWMVGAARQLTEARYAALGVLDEERVELERFLTDGLDAAEGGRIGRPPRGRGVLGELIRDPVPLRLADLGAHPHRHGFPPGHPEMRSFLGVPIMVGGVPFGNIYVADKEGGGEFSGDDEEAVALLAEFAGIAVDHARRR